jgi:Copper type II ascorbate-dependent monooxygenase, C-terminal domain
MTPSMGKGTRAALLASAVLALVVPLVAIAATRDGSGQAAAPSFRKDVAPIVQEKCAGCHRVGGIGPFSFETSRQVASRATVIGAAVEAGIMPPWPPGPESPAYVGEDKRRLTAAQRATILDWVKAGAPVDGPARKPPGQEPIPRHAGERVLDLRMPAAYRTSAPKGTTDDYRCFLLDPKLSRDMSVTSARIVPGARKVVHHVILFRVSRSQVPEAKALDAQSRGQGWSCFGGTGLSLGATSASLQGALNDANWVAAWAPGWGGNRVPDGTGVPLTARSQIVMQVHYNLLNGRAPDRSRAVLTAAPASRKLKPLRTMLLPGPVELACAPGEQGRLCSRSAALNELTRKYGFEAGFVPGGLLLLCGGDASNPRPSPVSTCDRRITQRTTIYVAAGHMHLLGASVRLELNPGTSRSRVLLDIPRWDFNWQNAYQLVEPAEARPGDVVRVTCRYDVAKRHHGGHGIPKTPRYVLWGEGTTDEMCLGILQVTRG